MCLHRGAWESQEKDYLVRRVIMRPLQLGNSTAFWDRPVLDSEIMVYVAFEVFGPLGPKDPPWGPMQTAKIPMLDLQGPFEVALTPFASAPRTRTVVLPQAVVAMTYLPFEALWIKRRVPVFGAYGPARSDTPGIWVP